MSISGLGLGSRDGSVAQGDVLSRRRGAGVVGQGVWVSPVGYFNPYFDGIGARVQNMLVPLEGNFDQRFEHQQDFLQ